MIDVRDVSDLPQKVEEATALFKDNKIDILVNSTGVVTKHDFWNTDEKEYDSIMDTNAKSTFFMSQAVGKQMVEKHIQGHILNITSSSALRPAWTPYQMSKCAVNGLTQVLADMMIPNGIVVNAIAPAPTATPMLAKKEGDSIYEPYTSSHRYAMSEELASLALLMVSDAGNMMWAIQFIWPEEAEQLPCTTKACGTVLPEYVYAFCFAMEKIKWKYLF